jgi:hypothetical protein
MSGVGVKTPDAGDHLHTRGSVSALPRRGGGTRKAVEPAQRRHAKPSGLNQPRSGAQVFIRGRKQHSARCASTDGRMGRSDQGSSRALYSCEEFERNHRVIADNATGKGSATVKGAVRCGELLLPGLLRCGHCGRKLHVSYSGKLGRYNCYGACAMARRGPSRLAV